MSTPSTEAGLSIYQSPDLTGTTLTYRDDEVSSHGPDHGHVYPGRRVVEVPGRTRPAARPEDCTDAGQTGEWLIGQVLVCPGCGLDAT